MTVKDKLNRLQDLLTGYHSCVIAFSGGVDSTLLLKAAKDVLGSRVLAVTAVSSAFPDQELAAAKDLAANLQVPLEIIKTNELANPEFAANPPNRCYFCKLELFGELTAIARSKGYSYVLDGANADDEGDFRPGLLAGRELGVLSPLSLAGITKAEVRELARQLGLPNWNKPSLACLSSRVPYGQPISAEKLRQIGAAEELLRTYGFGQYRVRHHGTIARIEVSPEDFPRLIATPLRRQLTDSLQQLGFTYITLDLAGFRSGSMNETLPVEVKNGSN